MVNTKNVWQYRLTDRFPRVFHWIKLATKHAGIKGDNDLIQSKWGPGCIYQHGMLEAPTEYTEYGESCMEYTQLDGIIAFNCFKEYLRTLGDIIKKIV